jgi:MFS transporter, DHA2 family, multidrug resistance protein
LIKTDELPVLRGLPLGIAGALLAIANFIVVLDMTVTNVSVPHIAGGLAVSLFEGTSVISSYAVAEAISVPLTGWLALRFGTLRVFNWGMLLFGLFSALCALSQSLGFLVLSRILQGLAGGPLMPLSQTLMLRIFPKNKQAMAVGIWGTTTLIAPVLGPIVGGTICDYGSWPLIFYLNIPIAIICSVVTQKILKPFETPTQKNKIDLIGLLLLILWVGAFQLMLDEGKNHDWFASNYIILLLLLSTIGFIAFLIWELTDKQPIVDLRVFRHRGYSSSVLTLSLTFGAFFGTVVLTPLWLQSTMAYTASSSGMAAAMIGILAVFMAPIAAKLSTKIDPRILVFFGILWIGTLIFFRSFCSTDMTYAQIAIPILIQGIGMPFFFLPLTGLALSSVDSHEVASAAGLMNFVRTLAGAFAVSLVTTHWDNQAKFFRAEMVEFIHVEKLTTPLAMLERLVDIQSFTLATNHVFVLISMVIFLASLIVWIAPKPKQAIEVSGAH